MIDWEVKARWENLVGNEYKIEERYDELEDFYKIRLSVKAGDHWFVEDSWATNDGYSIE